MSQICLKKLLFMLLTMVLLPAHVFAAKIDQKAHLPYFSKLQPFVTSIAFANTSIDFSEVSEETTQSPVSESHARLDTLALFNTQRWVSHLREGLDDEHVDVVGDLNTPFYADAGYAYSLMDINRRQNQSTFYHFTSGHRISGWKETNAMYVALNSQFSA
ncbi:hypothetical protein ATG66_0393 [Vibrio sp. ES.051]|uniref:hypothetical protein n=1 Tax=Vibrio sp. ES.051 TaxID=1761909 RepID=UPI000BFAA29F|nr:hypothetical protein [Vibrio sp. ES.051]PFG57894.1 hypothetical protein ATG66_0393 [Vibrio sp. ES.051]